MLETIKMFVLNQEILVQICAMYFVVWGLFEGFHSLIVRIIAICRGVKVVQNDLGKFLQVLWYVSILMVLVLGNF